MKHSEKAFELTTNLRVGRSNRSGRAKYTKGVFRQEAPSVYWRVRKLGKPTGPIVVKEQVLCC
jgi:hypothetical protein